MEEDPFSEGILGKLSTQYGRAEIAADELARREGLEDFNFEPTPNGCRVIAKGIDPTLEPEWGRTSAITFTSKTGSRYADLNKLLPEIQSFLVTKLAKSGGVWGADSWEHVIAIVGVIEGELRPIRDDCVEFLPRTDMEKLARRDFNEPLYKWWDKVTEYCLNKGKTPVADGGELLYPRIVVESGYRVLGTTVEGSGGHYSDENGKRDANEDRWGHWMGFSIDIPTKKWRVKWDPIISKSEFYNIMEPYAEASGLYRPLGDKDENHWCFDVRNLTPSTTLDEVRQKARELLKGK